MISTVLERASIVDGTGRPAFTTDIALVGERIAIVGDCTGREAHRRLDCRGSIAAPGFIDGCSHTGGRWLTLPRKSSKSEQAVTSEVCPIPLKSLQTGWEESLNFAEFLDLARRATYEAKGSFLADRDVRNACEAGARGVAIDLNLTSLSDAVGLATEAAAAGAPRAVVTLGALDDAIALAERASVHVHVAQAHEAPYPMQRLLEDVDRARTRGASISIDVYPYVAASIDVASLLPPGVDRDRLEDESFASAVALEMQARLGDAWPQLMLASVGSEERMDWCGMRFDDIGRAMRLSPARAALSFVRSEGDAARAFFFRMHESDVATALSAEFCTISSSAPSYALDERLFGNVHPRAYGCFPRVFGRYVRQKHALTVEEAVRRMTSLPARIFGLEDRGEIAEGRAADLVVFDETQFADTATYEASYTLPAGLRYRILDGKVSSNA
jgi:N-acyl-D-amino-acid deacylase